MSADVAAGAYCIHLGGFAACDGAVLWQGQTIWDSGNIGLQDFVHGKVNLDHLARRQGHWDAVGENTGAGMLSLNQELRIRLLISCLTASALSTLSLLIVTCVENVSLMYPWRWAIAAFSSLRTIRTAFALVLNGLLISAVTVVYHFSLTVSDRVAQKYYQLGSKIIWNNLRLIAISVILGFANAFVVLNVVGSGRYSSILSERSYFALNQRAHCLLCCGAFIGFMFSLTLLLFNRLTLHYSHPPKNMLDGLMEHTVTRALSTIGRILYFIPIYALLPKSFFGAFDPWISTWVLLMDLRMLALLFIVGFHIQFSWGCAVHILTSQFVKPTSVPFSSIVHSEGINQSMNEVEKHLALEHLADLVATDQATRSSIFALNNLGGRPVLWRHISTWCMTVIEKFTAKVQSSNTEEVKRMSSSALSEMKYRSNLPPSFVPGFRSSILPGRPPLQPCDTACRNLEPSGGLLDLAAQHKLGALSKVLGNRIVQFGSHVPIIQALGTELPFAATADLFCGIPDPTNPSSLASGQAIIWAVEILACLTLASYTEDSYGSVQASLGRILVLFADGLEAVERHLRLVGLLTTESALNARSLAGGLEPSTSDSQIYSPPNPRSPAAEKRRKVVDRCNLSYYRFSSDPSLPWRLYATLTWALMNSLNQFGDHLESIQISAKSKERLELLRRTRCVKE
ncbi:unnamed protein product [Calicophoron daubneyi]|uniref:Nucleoporin NDC1 n=1 Tax=Calicophoron daubneyi TaxID=300641 RepID=A0AAV2TGH9_CALDB